MTTELIVALFVTGWVAFGPLLSLLMGRRGHSAAAWGVTGMFLGPMAVPVALSATRRRRQAPPTVLREATGAGSGPISVLAGVDGSEESLAALAHAAALLGDRMKRLTLVHVASVDAAGDNVLMQREVTAARAWMAAAREQLAGIPVQECVVAGRPVTALVSMAAKDHHDLIVVGSRGRGMSPRLLGSVARDLAGSSAVPVLVGGAPQHRQPHNTPGTVELDLATR